MAIRKKGSGKGRKTKRVSPQKTSAPKKHKKRESLKAKSTPKRRRKQKKSAPLHPYLIPVLLGIAILFFILIRLNFLDIPFERDEGIYSYMGKLQLEGARTYVDFYEMKPPGLYYGYAIIIALFGYSLQGLHIGFILLNIVTVVLVYLISEYLLNRSAGLISALSYGLLSLTPAFHGFTVQAEQMLVPLALAGFYFTLNSLKNENRRLVFLGGVFSGLAFLVKQNSIFFIAITGLAILLFYLLNKKLQNKLKTTVFQAAIYSAGVLLPVALTLIVLWIQGVFSDFIYWIYEYPSTYLSRISYEDGLTYFKYWFKNAMPGYWPFWVLAGAGLLLSPWIKVSRYIKILFWVLAFFSFLTIVPGLRFYGHYWIMLLPAVAIITGIVFFAVEEFLKQRWNFRILALAGILLFLPVFIYNIIYQQAYYFNPNHKQLLDRHYAGNAFYEAKQLSDRLNQYMGPEDKLMVLGSEPQIYVYTKKRSPSRHIFMPYLGKNTDESRAWAEEAKADLQNANPEYIVLVINRYSWNIHVDDFYKWSYDYTVSNYEPIGWIDVISPGNVKHVWGDAARTYKAQSNNYYTVYRRR